MNNIELGRFGETETYNYLTKMKYFIVDKNFRCKYGEIDIIAVDKDELVFIEVKTRSSNMYGEAREAVNIVKRKHIKKAALFYIAKNNMENHFIRFDIIEVYKKKDKLFIKHIKNTLW